MGIFNSILFENEQNDDYKDHKKSEDSDDDDDEEMEEVEIEKEEDYGKEKYSKYGKPCFHNDIMDRLKEYCYYEAYLKSWDARKLLSNNSLYNNRDIHHHESSGIFESIQLI